MRFLMFHTDNFLIFQIMTLLQLTGSFIEVPLPGNPPLEMQRFLEAILPSFYQCMELCVAYKLCQTLSFDRDSGKCWLNSDGYDRQSSQWLFGSTDQTMKKELIPKGIGGSCSEHACAIDEMCVQAGQVYICVKHGYSTVKCPESWGHTDDLCIILDTINGTTWTEAEGYCASTGAELLTFESHEQYLQYKRWIYFRITALTRNTTSSGKIWARQMYSLDLPRWMPIETMATQNNNLCLGVAYNRISPQKLLIGPMEAVSCDENNGFACQHRAPDHWP